MSSIQHRTTSAGEERWRVMWRSAGSQQARTFTDETDARKWRVLLDALGEERALAALNDGAAPTETRTVAEQDLPMDPLVKAAMRRWAAVHRPAHQSTTACLTSPHLASTPCNSIPGVSR